MCFGRGGLHSLLTAIVIKKKSVNTLYHHILFLTFVNIVSKLQIIYPTSNETKPNKNKNIFIFYFLPFKILPTLKKYVCVEGFIA